MKRIILGTLVCLLSGCTSYERFIQTLNDRQVTSCIQADLAVGAFLAGGSGAVHVYTATGGANLQDCINVMKYGQAAQTRMPAIRTPWEACEGICPDGN